MEGTGLGKRFNRLAEKVTREYEKKGYPKEEAETWGKDTAGKVYRDQEAEETSAE